MSSRKRKFLSLNSKKLAFFFLSYSSSFVTALNLTAGAPSLIVAEPILAAQQYINVDVVSVNDTFNLSSIIVDGISKKKVGNIAWGNFNWTASASLYTSVQYQSNGSLIGSVSSAVVVDTTAGTITATNLAINEPGMYVVKLQIRSSNNVYALILTSNAILVKANTSKLKKEIEMIERNTFRCSCSENLDRRSTSEYHIQRRLLRHVS